MHMDMQYFSGTVHHLRWNPYVTEPGGVGFQAYGASATSVLTRGGGFEGGRPNFAYSVMCRCDDGACVSKWR